VPGESSVAGRHSLARRQRIGPATFCLQMDRDSDTMPQMNDKSSAPEGAFSSEGRPAAAEQVADGAESDAAVASVKEKRPPSALRRYGVTALVAAIVATVVAGAVATIVSVGIHFGMAGTGGDRGGRFMQEGRLNLGNNGPRQVFYAEPFAGPPKLELESSSMVFIKLKEQKADHFVVESAVICEIRWRAEGMRVPR
jgi:hypothetical protein